MAHPALSEKIVATTKKKHYLLFGKNRLPIKFSNTRNCAKKRSIYGIIGSTLHWLIQLTKKFISVLILYTSSLQESNMIFSVSNDGIELSVDFEPDSVTLTVDLVQKMTINPQETPLAAWSFLLSKDRASGTTI